MSQILETLWNEYFAEKCAAIETEEERSLIKESAEKREVLEKALTSEQITFFERYADALHVVQSYESKKAFLKGCKFIISLLFETKWF